MNVKFSVLIELLLTVLPLLARRDSFSFVFVHFCSSPSRHGVRPVHSQWHFSGRGYRKEFARCLERPRADVLAAIFFVSVCAFNRRTGQRFTGPFQLKKTFINGTLRYGDTGRSSHRVSKGKGLERTSLQQYCSSIINGTLRYGGTGRSSHDVSKGLERTSLQQLFSP